MLNLEAIILNGVCLIFAIFITIIYYSKKKIKNADTTSYSYLLIVDIISCIVFILDYILFIYTPDNILLIRIISGISIIGQILFLIILLYYGFMLITETDSKVATYYKNNTKKVEWIINGYIILLFIIEYILPMEYYRDSSGTIEYIYGLSTTPLIIIGVIAPALFVIPLIIANFKSINKKRSSPLFAVIAFELITMGLFSILPTIAVTNISLTLACYWMYFTMENPDIKVIAELELARDQAEKSNNAKSDFLSSMSHEIKTPLNAIVGITQVLETEDNIEVIREDLKDIIVATENLSDIVNSILDINKIEDNKVEVENVEYNPIEEFDKILKLLEIRAKDKNIEIRKKYSDNIPHILKGDKEKLRRILNNLLVNSIKYTNSGYAALMVDCINTKDMSKLIIKVQDSGRGLTDEQKENIYSKFNRLDIDKDSNISGIGLGLSITKSLIDLMNGTISVDSTEGIGTTFTIELNQVIVEKELSNSDIETL